MFRHKFTLSGLAGALVLVLMVLAFTPRASQAADAVWRAKYWNNTSLSGKPVLERDENAIDYDWGERRAAGPGVRLDNWSAQWRRTVHFDKSGTYRFTATMDDGMRIYVDDVLIMDEWAPHAGVTREVDHYLSAGDHKVKVQYYDGILGAMARVSWRRVSDAPATVNNWRGEYYGNRSLSGSPAVVRDDAQISFYWQTGSPVPGTVPADNFSVRWTRTLNLPAGRYQFTTTTDDGVRLWVNNQLLIDRWVFQNATTYSAEITVPGGGVPVKMEYFEAGGEASAYLNWVLLSAAPPPTISEWRGEYYTNPNLSGTPAVIRNDANIDFNWGEGAPISGFDRDNFSVRWTRSLTLPPGRYRFTATTDDGVRLWVNNQLLIDRWFTQEAQPRSAEYEHLGGPVPVRMEYFERTGFAVARLSWQLVSSPPTGTGGLGTATVTAGALNVRSGPGTNYNILTAVARGTRLNLLGYRNSAANWIMVALPNGTQGWVHTGYVQTTVAVTSLAVWDGQSGTPGPTPPPAQPPTQPGTMAATVSTYHLNMRSGPGTGYTILRVLDLGDALTLSYRNTAGNWVYGTLSNGTQGWVHAGYLRTPQTVTTLPVWNG